MSKKLIGHVFNKMLAKEIPVFLSESGPEFKRVLEASEPVYTEKAFKKIKMAIDSGKLFADEAMNTIEQVTVTNMLHKSKDDLNEHYSVQGEASSGIKVKGGHVQEDESKQTQAK